MLLADINRNEETIFKCIELIIKNNYFNDIKIENKIEKVDDKIEVKIQDKIDDKIEDKIDDKIDDKIEDNYVKIESKLDVKNVF